MNNIYDDNNDTVDGYDSTIGQMSDSAIAQLHGTTLTQPHNSSSRTPFTKSLSMTSTTSGTVPSNEILSNLDDRLCLTALEIVMTLLASQSLLSLFDVNLSSREKQLIKRELSTELSIYHDFVRKRISIDANRPLYRKKRGVIPIQNLVFHQNLPKPKQQITMDNKPTTSAVPRQHSMRVDTIRKLHLTASQTTPVSSSLKRNTFEMGRDISPIGVSTPKRGNLPAYASSTPLEQAPTVSAAPITPRPILKPVGGLRRKSSEDSNIGGRRRISINEEELIMLNPEEPGFTGLSFVKLVEEDYFHFLSNLFTHICHTQNE